MADSQNHSPPPADGSPTGTSRSLLSAARCNDAAAWDRLIGLYAPLVLYWCRRAGLNEDAAADVSQDVFGAAAANIQRFRRRGPADSFRGWLRTITRNKILDHFRRRQADPRAAGGTTAQMRLAQVAEETAATAPLGDEPDGAERAAVSQVIGLALERVRRGVAERTWQAFWRVAVEGQDASDVAGQLDMSVGGVRVAKSRVLQRLRAELGELSE